jgi:hypothetical protein
MGSAPVSLCRNVDMDFREPLLGSRVNKDKQEWVDSSGVTLPVFLSRRTGKGREERRCVYR